MKLKKIFIYGKHNNRTPFAYQEYRKLFSRHFEFVDSPNHADYLVVGFCLDISDGALEITEFIKCNPNLTIVVLSEEPLWDTLWDRHFQNSTGVVRRANKELNYHVLNHLTSKIYDFERIPYFITTNDNFYLRYSNLFKRNRAIKAKDYQRQWHSARSKYVFYAEKRIDSSFDVSYQNNTIVGLNSYRSQIAASLLLKGATCVGQGWGAVPRRQALPDWHLDKLAALDGQSFIVSGLENTHIANYVSEKIFDSFATQSIPLYFAQPNHCLFNVVDEGSFINLAGADVDNAIDLIGRFSVTSEFLDSYLIAQEKLSALFSSPAYYLSERNRVVRETVKAFADI
jgi:hypothetical protein